MLLKTSEEKNIIRRLKQYVKKQYPSIESLITYQQYRQLSWNDAYKNSNQALLCKNSTLDADLPFQTKRILARLYFLNAMRNKSIEEALSLIRDGQAAHDQINESSFSLLAGMIKTLTNAEYQQLWVACQCSVNKIVKTKVKNISNFGKIPTDSVDFLAKVISKNPKIYPAVAELLKDRTAKEAFQKIFTIGHLRHMLDLEGGLEMLESFYHHRQNLTEQTFNLWLCYWLIDIMSLSIHPENGKGSQYLTQSVAHTFLLLCANLKQSLTDPKRPNLKNYIDNRAAYLGLPAPDNLSIFHRIPREEQLLTIKLLALCRIFYANDAIIADVRKEIELLKENPSDYQNILSLLNPLRDNKMPTPTYIPVVLCNLYEKTQSYAKSIATCIPLIARIMQHYEARCVSFLDDIHPPLNFNKLAEPSCLQLMQNKNFDILTDHQTGEVSLIECVPTSIASLRPS